MSIQQACRIAMALIVAVWCALPASAQQVPHSAAQMQLSFVPLVKETAPAVVNIYATIMRPERRSPFSDDPFFQRFFQGFQRPQPRVENSLGSGVILSDDGIVVSNYHVVGQATDIRVVLSDRREFSARVLLGDAESDLAILQIDDARDLPHVTVRTSDTVEVGELVLAIGNPFGVGQTVSSGIVSGLARSGAALGNGRGYFIQTDAPINPGNSGGALIDMAGRLIGINTSILTRSGGSNGIGFAIPSDLVAAFVAQAKTGNTRFARPWAGMTGQPVDTEIAQAFGFERPEGIIVSGLHPVSPFSAAGVAVGDVIVAVNGQPVNTPAEMVYRMSVTGLGEQAQIGVMRDGRLREVAVSLLQAPDDPPRDPRVLDLGEVLDGLALERVNPAVIAAFNLPLQSAGVVVTDPGPLGARVGLQRGDVITAVNDTVVTHPDTVATALSQRARSFVLEVMRGDRPVAIRFRV